MADNLKRIYSRLLRIPVIGLFIGAAVRFGKLLIGAEGREADRRIVHLTEAVDALRGDIDALTRQVRAMDTTPDKKASGDET